MKTLKELLAEKHACYHAREWVVDKTIEQAVAECPRGDWLLWIGDYVNIDLQLLTLAKGHCANTVRHLMKDRRSVEAIDIAIAYGEGKASIEELKIAAHAARIVYETTSTSSNNYALTAYAASNLYASATHAAFTGNQMQTADICRKYIGELIINKVNELLTYE